jgi:NAD(P)-dependent dehydrogenase (short-subunit alcohol dehydrogenase family)
MLLKNKNAIIYGAAGSVGSALARAFAREGARVFLTGRKAAPLVSLVAEIVAAGGQAESAIVDALDGQAVDAHLASVVEKAASIDISFNAIGIPQPGIQGTPLTDLPVENFLQPILAYSRAHFLTARGAARHMLTRKSGVILMHTPEPGRAGAPLVGGMGPAWAAMEALTRDLAAEYGAHGIRPICLRSTGLPETETISVVFGLHAKANGIPREQFQAMMDNMSYHRRSTTLAELAGAAVFAASDLSRGLVGTVINLTAGKSAD